MQEYRKLQERTNEDLVKEYQTTHNEDLFRALLEKNTGLLHIIVMDYRIPKYEIEDEERIKSLEAKIIKGGSDEERAVKAIAEAKEYLEIVAGSRVRDNGKCLAFIFFILNVKEFDII